MNKNPNPEAINISDAPSFQESEGTKKATEPASLASIGGIIAAFFASLCCIGPVVFAALGVGVGATGVLASTAGFLKAFVPYRPFFIVIAMVAIGTGFYLVYRKPKTACAPDSYCLENPPHPPLSKGGKGGFHDARVAHRVMRNCMDSRTRSKSVVFLWMATVLTLFLVLSPYWLEIFK